MGERRRLLEARLAEVEAELASSWIAVEQAEASRDHYRAALAAAEARARYLADELEASRGRSLPRGDGG